MADMNFSGTNTRSLQRFLNEQASDLQVITKQDGKMFAVLTDVSGDNRYVTISENCQNDIKANGFLPNSEYQVSDMPGTDAATGLPNGSIFFLLTKAAKVNVSYTFKR